MQWDRLLSSQRFGDDRYQGQKSRSVFVQDHDRIVFSAPFRRLANKTQVQPLYEHDHVHHRLIHSIEVSSVGRSLATRIGQWLAGQGAIATAEVDDLANIVQAACVAHDIGNPPFGHSGEEVMGAWFQDRFATSGGLFAEIPAGQQREFTAFEGNAQGFRILTRLEMYRGDGGMRLCKATLGAFTKYPVGAADRDLIRADDPAGAGYVGLKKFGLFQSDLPAFRDVAETLGLPERISGAGRFWARHPLVFLMEAADDITYNIVDLEDAFTTGELPYDRVRAILADIAGATKPRPASMTPAEDIASLRARSIGAAVEACEAAFVQHYEAIMQGRFSGDLIGASRLGPAFAEVKALAGDQIFTAPRKTELEISGRRIIANVMSGILPVYEDMARCGWDAEKLSPHSQQLARALALDLRDLQDADTALHALADFTSGMTDRYALRISRMLSGS